MPSIIDISEAFVGSWNTCLADLVKEAMSNANETNSSTADVTRLLIKTKKTFTNYVGNVDKIVLERASQQENLDKAIETRRSLHLTVAGINTTIAAITKMKRCK